MTFILLFCRMPSTYMTSSIDYPSLDHSVNSVESTQTGNRSDPVSTFSTQRSLAEALHERGVGHSIAGWSGLSTPNNSPGCPSPDGSSSRFFYETWGLLAQGAKMIRRTLTGEETPLAPAPPPVPRIARKELEVFLFNFWYPVGKLMLRSTICLFPPVFLDSLPNAFIGQTGETWSRWC